MSDETQIIDVAADGTERKSSMNEDQKNRLMKAAAIFTATAAGVLLGASGAVAYESHPHGVKAEPAHPAGAPAKHDDKAHHAAAAHHDAHAQHAGTHHPGHHTGAHHDAGHAAPVVAAAAVVHETAPHATNVLDTMSEHDAFAIARQEIGPGGMYMYHGKYFSTYTKEEQEQMTDHHKEAFAASTGGKEVAHTGISSADTQEVPIADHKDAFEAIKHQVVEVEGNKYPMQVVKDHHGKVVYKVDAKGDGSYSTLIKVKDQEHNLWNRVFGHHHHHHADDAHTTADATAAVAHDAKHDDHKTDDTHAKADDGHASAKTDAGHAVTATAADHHDAPADAAHDATAADPTAHDAGHGVADVHSGAPDMGHTDLTAGMSTHA